MLITFTFIQNTHTHNSFFLYLELHCRDTRFRIDHQETIVQSKKHQIERYQSSLRIGHLEFHVVVEHVTSQFDDFGFQSERLELHTEYNVASVVCTRCHGIGVLVQYILSS